MSKITYENKEQLNTNENIPAKNKCMASDLNEIKSIVNENDTNALYKKNVKTTKTDSDNDTYSCNYVNSALEEHYSTEETFTGKYWIDGKKIYRKVISVSNMEISSAASISTGITNLNELISLNGIYTNISAGTKTPYPMTQNTGTILNCVYYQGNIGFVGNETYSIGPDRIHTFILEYTKTTE